MHGLWELSDPSTPTFKSGNSLDKFLFLAGDTVPLAFLPSRAPSENDTDALGAMETHYPAVVSDGNIIGNHHAVMLDIPYEEETYQSKVRVLRVKTITDEAWMEKDNEIAHVLAGQHESFQKEIRLGNAAKAYELIQTAIQMTLQDCYAKSGPSGLPLLTPFEKFYRRNQNHPEAHHLLHAKNTGNQTEFNRLVRCIKRDSWHEYLARIRPATATQIFKFIEKNDGRRPRAHRYPCSGPLTHEGETVTKCQAKCDLLGDYFQQRLAKPQLPAEEQMKTNSPHTEKGKRSCLPVQKTGKGPAGKPTKTVKGTKGKKPNKQRHAATWDVCPTEWLVPVRAVEVAKAIDSMGTSKSPGPDGLLAEVFKNMPSLTQPLATLFTKILERGAIPNTMMELYIIPLEKPDKDPKLCTSKRPISLLCIVAKILEAVVLNRLLPALERRLNPAQFAYRRSRGTEMHLQEMSDFAHEAIDKGEFVYIASLDIDGAFDKVPHDNLLQTLAGTGADPYLLRYIGRWLCDRRFRLRLATPYGRFLSTKRPITRGLPQGGVLSPFLWLLHFDTLHKLVESLRGTWKGAMALLRVLAVFFADDVAFAVAHQDPEVLVGGATSIAQTLEGHLDSLGLALSSPKSFNVVVSPGSILGSLFRRGGTATRSTQGDSEKHEDQIAALHKMEIDSGGSPEGVFPEGLMQTCHTSRWRHSRFWA